MTRRAAPGKRWSASSTTTELSGGRIQVRYRLDGKNRKKTFATAEDATAFQHRLLVAYHDDWPADDDHQPVPPVALPAAQPSEPMDLPTLRVDDVVDIVGVCDWFLNRMRNTPKRRGGTKRSMKTIGDAENICAFICRYAVYPAGDPRLAEVGAEVGDPLRFGDGGFDAHDIARLIDIRSTTNLTKRARNDRHLARWAAQLAKEETAAERDGRDVVIPPAPDMVEEVASARTVEAFCNQLKAILTAAHLHQIIDSPVWTAACDDLTITAAPTNYTTKTLPNSEQVARLAEGIAALERRTRGVDGRMCDTDGARYSAMVALIGTAALREEELAAARLSWLHLDGPRPYIDVAWSEVYAPGDDGRERIQGPLKHRHPGETRIVWLEPALVDVMRAHVTEFVAAPAANSHDQARRDPYLFTTHRGAPIDFSNWVTNWWKPTVAATFNRPGEQHLATLTFNRLRAAAITSWLLAGHTLDHCARQAGNTQAVIETYYKGVIAEARANGVAAAA